ncbi:hypothetical protein ABEG18_03420 [Alsobacter sp. KACC 23698]|uniref:CHRD domain-containing protein n=1 Tax=Alsobacter sp. KACC 23698 TaxID=3149229 RepID=A0AAU7JI56_9HYPH
MLLGQGHQRSDVDLMQERKLMFHATGDKDFLAADHFYFAEFTTLNHSGVTGGAVLALDDQTHTLTVAISAMGLEPNQPHIQHIHGFVDGTASHTPTTASDADGDGYVELGEGLPQYGQILLNLTVDHANATGQDNGHSHDGALTGFPTAPNGVISYVESFTLPAGKLSQDTMLDLREIVLHGLTVPAGPGAGTPGEVDGTAGYKLVLPVASGEISEVSSAHDLHSLVGQIALAHGLDGWMI